MLGVFFNGNYIGLKYFLLVNSPILFHRLYRAFYPKPTPKRVTILSDTDDYVERNSTQFLKSFEIHPAKDTKLLNTNMNSEFYSKESYQTIIKKEDNHIEQEWKRRILFENTPRGNVIMFYDPYKLAFAYYCDTNSLPYRVLNAVAMKYVVTFHCRHLFVDNSVTTAENVSPLIQTLFVDTPDKSKNKDLSAGIDKKNAAFAKFKKYEASKAAGKENDKKSSVHSNQNKFVCVGKIINYSFIQKVKPGNPTNGFQSKLLDNLSAETTLQKQVLSYKDFKTRAN
jgi:hypothetical protein